MSEEAKVVAQDKEGAKAFEILTALHQKYDVLNSRIGAVEALVKQIGSLEKSLVSFSHDLEGLSESVKLEKRKSIESADQKEASFKEVLRKLDQFSVQLVSYEGTLKDLRNAQDSFEKSSFVSSQRLMERLEEVRRNSLPVAEFIAQNQKVDSKVSDLHKDFKDLSCQVGEISFKYTMLSDSLQLEKPKHQIHSTAIADISNSLNRHALRVVEKFNEVSSQIEARAKECKAKSEKDVEALRAELQGSPASVSHIKEEISQRMDIIALDASNAVLKASNVDQQFRILDRKFENIVQVVKKLELNK